MRRFRVAYGVLALAIGSALWAFAMTPAPIFLTCNADPKVSEAAQQALCDELADQLRAANPNRTVERNGTAPEGALRVVLTVTQSLPQQITAHLVWQDQDTQGSTPPLSLSVVDTLLAPPMYGQLVAALIKQSGIEK